MTRRKRHGRVTESGRFEFNKGTPEFRADVPLRERIEVLHVFFSPNNTILDIDDFLDIYAENVDCSLWLSHRDNPRYDHFPIQNDYAFRLVSHSPTRPIANIVFGYLDDGSVYTYQNQGRKGEKEILDKIDWDRMNYHLLWCFASQFGFPRVRIQKADHNIYYKEPIDSEREGFGDSKRGKELYRKRLMRRYTLLPFELGYVNSPDLKTSYKDTNTVNRGYFIADSILSIFKSTFRREAIRIKVRLEDDDTRYVIKEDGFDAEFLISKDGDWAAVPNFLVEDDNPYKIASADVLTSGNIQFDDGMYYNPMDSGTAVELIEHISDAGHDDFINHLMARTADLLEKSDEYLKDAESDLDQASPVPVAVEKEPVIARKSDTLRKEALNGNLKTKNVSATRNANNSNDNNLKAAISGSTRLGRLVNNS